MRIFSHWSRETRSLWCGNHYRRELAQSTYTWVTLPSANRRVAMHTSMQMRPASPWNPAIRIRASKRIDVHRQKKSVCRSRSTCHDFADSSRESKEEISSQVTIFALIIFFLLGYFIPFFLLFFSFSFRRSLRFKDNYSNTFFFFFFLLRDRISVTAINRLVTGNFLKKECFRSNYGKKRLNGLIVLLWRSN